MLKMESWERIISDTTLRIGVPPHIQGYRYVQVAVRLVLENPDMIHRITKELYPAVARTCDTTNTKVERSIRHAVGVVWDRGRAGAFNELFGHEVCSQEIRPSNGEFIALLAEACKQQTTMAV